MPCRTINAVYGKLAPFVAESLQPVDVKRKPCAIAHGPMACSPLISRRILETAIDVIADAQVRSESISVSREVARRMRLPVAIVDQALMGWLIRFRCEAATLRTGVLNALTLADEAMEAAC